MMASRQMRIRRQCRSARVSALTQEERRRELREAEVRAARIREHTESNVGEDMTSSIHLACDVCGQEFLVPAEAYQARSGVVECPRCGSSDLILTDRGESARSGRATSVR
jgi:hypothetical protein